MIDPIQIPITMIQQEIYYAELRYKRLADSFFNLVMAGGGTKIEATKENIRKSMERLDKQIEKLEEIADNPDDYIPKMKK